MYVFVKGPGQQPDNNHPERKKSILVWDPDSGPLLPSRIKFYQYCHLVKAKTSSEVNGRDLFVAAAKTVLLFSSNRLIFVEETCTWL